MNRITKQQREYYKWYKRKLYIQYIVDRAPRYKERDVWWISLGLNIGVEENGKGDLFQRPVLIIRGFNKQQVWGVPITTKIKSGTYYYSFRLNAHFRTALLSQLRVIDTKRFINKLGTVDQQTFNEIKCKISEIMG